jgi:hypothetical protein
MGPTRKPNVCIRLSLRALGFFARDAGVGQRMNLGILRALVCQVTARGLGPPARVQCHALGSLLRDSLRWGGE